MRQLAKRDRATGRQANRRRRYSPWPAVLSRARDTVKRLRGQGRYLPGPRRYPRRDELNPPDGHGTAPGFAGYTWGSVGLGRRDEFTVERKRSRPGACSQHPCELWGINAVAGVGGSSPPGTPRANAPGRWSNRTINRTTNPGGSGFTRRMNTAFAPAVRGSVPSMRTVQ